MNDRVTGGSSIISSASPLIPPPSTHPSLIPLLVLHPSSTPLPPRLMLFLHSIPSLSSVSFFICLSHPFLTWFPFTTSNFSPTRLSHHSSPSTRLEGVRSSQHFHPRSKIYRYLLSGPFFSVAAAGNGGDKCSSLHCDVSVLVLWFSCFLLQRRFTRARGVPVRACVRRLGVDIARGQSRMNSSPTGVAPAYLGAWRGKNAAFVRVCQSVRRVGVSGGGNEGGRRRGGGG